MTGKAAAAVLVLAAAVAADRLRRECDPPDAMEDD